MVKLVEMISPAGRRMVRKSEAKRMKKKGWKYVDAKDDDSTDVIKQIKKMSIKECKAFIKAEGLNITASNYSKKKELQNAIIDVLENRG